MHASLGDWPGAAEAYGAAADAWTAEPRQRARALLGRGVALDRQVGFAPHASEAASLLPRQTSCLKEVGGRKGTRPLERAVSRRKRPYCMLHVEAIAEGNGGSATPYFNVQPSCHLAHQCMMNVLV